MKRTYPLIVLACVAALGLQLPAAAVTDPGRADQWGLKRVGAATAWATTRGKGMPKAKIMPVRVLDEEAKGSASDVVLGVRWAVDHGADIINLSLGDLGQPVFGPAFGEALDYAWNAGVTPVVAAGNEYVTSSGYADEPAERSYVLEVDPSANRVVVGPEELLDRRGLLAEVVGWVGRRPEEPFEADAQIRYRSPAVRAVVEPEGDRARVEFRTPQRAVAPGQSVVFYSGDEVLGGGTIASALR